MTETFFIGAYWKARKASIGECAQLATGFLEGLANCDPLFHHWFKRGRSRREALSQEISVNQASLLGLLSVGQVLSDKGQVMEDLGFRLSLWTGGTNDGSASLNIRCGAYTPDLTANACVIQLPTDKLIAARVLTVPTLVAIMRCVVSIWKPDWGTVMSHDHRNLLKDQRDNSPQIGWITYLSVPSENIPSSIAPARTVSLQPNGSLIVVTDERFTASDVNHIQTANQVTAELSRRNLLKAV